MRDDLVDEIARVMLKEIPFLVEYDIRAGEMTLAEARAISAAILPVIEREIERLYGDMVTVDRMKLGKQDAP